MPPQLLHNNCLDSIKTKTRSECTVAVWLAGCVEIFTTTIHTTVVNSGNSNNYYCLKIGLYVWLPTCKGFVKLCIFFCSVFKRFKNLRIWCLWFVFVFRAAYVSFGGLLMRLQGDANTLHGFEVDQHMYLLMKKLAF